MLSLGERFDRYTIEAHLGAGAAAHRVDRRSVGERTWRAVAAGEAEVDDAALVSRAGDALLEGLPLEGRFS
jgi:hypothetical protein